ncbi:ABC transporter substrate-binding protein [Halosimplex litoreum]|uniref:ABC transporter substrate-binding protein n=1 Tax=Halosimplex litoreum TaxID=1198301 RepID=A0A7T3FZX5_9EURY|nr:ABC transporter substrate-binding protein [Halosimplex litoreum]QPV63829.1 ABC transporter substrate-binding protein [Halosimplex litoreum]
MADEPNDEAGSTRREYLLYGAVLGSGVVAGCVGGSDATDTPGSATTDTPAPTETATPTATPSADETETATETPTPTETQTYSATMAPVGTLELDAAPERVVDGWGFEADVLTALGQADTLVASEGPQFWFTGFYDKLPGVSAPDPDSLDKVVTDDWAVRTEFLYELDPDLFASDPNRYLTYYGLSEEEAAELRDNIAPFFGNASRRKRGDGWSTWPAGEEYPYYTIPEYVSRYGDLFGVPGRASALNEFYTGALEEMRSRVPAESERPSVGVLNAMINPETEGSFHIYDPYTGFEKTHGKKQYRDMGVVDAFEGEYGGESGTKVDYEGLLDADPDVIVFHFGVNYRDWNGEDALRKTVEGMRDSSLGQQLTAVQNDELYVGGSAYQGPIINLFQTEMLGKQLYPEAFGEWPGKVASGKLPDIPAEEQVFDRQRLADIVTGDG